MKENSKLRKLFEDTVCDFKKLGTQHSKRFITALEIQVESVETEADTKYLINYFKACTRKHGNNLGCNQATKMLSNAYRKVFDITV